MSETGTEHGHGHEEATYPYTPHHFHAAKQHFESGKMGVWLFLVTEILFFAGLFCAYTVYRAQHPEVFYWAHFYLDTKWGAINTVVLIVSSFTAAWAVRNAQLGQMKMLKTNILITILCAFGFMGIKTIEYTAKFHHGTLPARHFHPHEEVWETETFKHKHPEAAVAAERIVAAIEARKEKSAAVRDEVIGRDAPLALVPVSNDGETVAAAPAEAPAEPEATAAPAEAESDAAPAEAEAPSEEAAPAEAMAEPAAEPEAEVADDVWLESEIRNLSEKERRPLEMAGIIQRVGDGPLEFARPAKAGVFFSIYFFMTGLHGLHVLIGIGLWVWMLAIASKRKMGEKYFGPIDFTALYWHLVDLIWIYLFPMLYLIH